ncbi:hypothetical protein AB4Z40_32030 [Bosea sp. 2YAB26]|uniref:hypothetical protein n=1 Tax=Bosea sp. 2YAB26 TaxID=3237478 RepID=UPI003F93B6D6
MSVVEEYLSAKADFTRFETQLGEYATQIQTVATALMRQPGRMIFANVESGLPMEASMSRDSISFNGSEWKTAGQLQALLAEWHEKRRRMTSAWGAVPSDMKPNLSGPDERNQRR